jgi:hypothetical protein
VLLLVHGFQHPPGIGWLEESEGRTQDGMERAMEMDEASASGGDGSPVYEVPGELDVSVWLEQDVEAFVNGVLSAMRTIAEQVPLMVTSPAVSQVWKDPFHPLHVTGT